jgi:hypothetical protein
MQQFAQAGFELFAGIFGDVESGDPNQDSFGDHFSGSKPIDHCQE